MLTVWCVCVGDKYTDDYVYRLKAMVERNLSLPFSFVCLSDRAIPNIDCYLTPVNWPGWWQKLYLFEAAKDIGGHHLYFDLDVVISGPLDSLVSDSLSMPANWAQSGHGGCQSSVMAWSGDYSFITDSFDASELHNPVDGNFGYYGNKSLWGDQEFITDLLGDPGNGVVNAMAGIYSYKYHCRASLPNDASVVCFHGKPKPHEVTDKWVIDARNCSLQPIDSLAS